MARSLMDLVWDGLVSAVYTRTDIQYANACFQLVVRRLVDLYKVTASATRTTSTRSAAGVLKYSICLL